MYQPERIEDRIIQACAMPLGYKTRSAIEPTPDSVGSINWEYILDLASHHRITPLLHYFLSKNDQISVPEEVAAVLKRLASGLAVTNLFQTQELLRILDLLKSNGLDAIPFKGPVLGDYLYNNLGIRPFGDLDILIHKAHFSTTKKILIENGYQCFRKFNPTEEAKFIDTQMGFEFVRDDEQSVIEVHWSFLNTVHAFKLSEADVWQAKQQISVLGKEVNMFSPAHLLVYLCAHGSKSLWARMRWLCDVAELVTQHQETQFWRDVQRVAKASKGLRMLNTGLFLAKELLNAPIPDAVWALVQADTKAGELAHKVIQGYFSPDPAVLAEVNPVTFHLDLQERFLDRIPYYKHLFRIWLAPSSKDRAFVPLPKRLEFLYILVKPIRLLMRRGS